MKSLALAITLIAAVVTANAQTFTDAIEYNDFIVANQTKVGEKILVFSEMIGNDGMTKAAIMPALEDMLTAAKESVVAVKGLGPFEGESQLKEAALALFQFYVRIIDKDYRDMVSILYDSDLDDAALIRLNEIVAKVQSDEITYDASFQTAQKDFALKHNITLIENELQEELDKD